MLKFNFANCYSDLVGEHGISKGEIEKAGSRISAAVKQLQKWRETEDALFFDFPFSEGLAQSLMTASVNYRDKFDNLVILGIGGSALGLSFLANALLPPYYNIFSDGMKLFVCDNVDPDSFVALLKNLDIKRTLFNIISKSGGTVETASQSFLAIELLRKKLGDDWTQNIIATTDPKSGCLRAYADEHRMKTFDIPPKLGGRYSVLSAVGLLPAAILGMDVEGLVDGARRALEYCERASIEENHALHIAILSYLLDVRNGKKISVMIPYADSLRLFADWYAQLWGESVGKSGKGTTPVKALGATDQHSQLQLYMEGPNDKMITFVGVEEFREETEKIVPQMDGFDHLKNKNLADLLHAEQKATAAALTKVQRPNMTITLSGLDSKNIGELIFLYEAATALTGALYEINPFDQPGVELGKKLTKEFLK